mmetsp:Transcript_23443/g.27677  ORF Transcript_23443/g.27677 Transcript_23443/m.27677 type:complete len:394 (+) Transcript_23443:118-1299(+)
MMKSVVRKDVTDVEIASANMSPDAFAEENNNLIPQETVGKTIPDQAKQTSISKTGLRILILLALQNCGKNILMRFVMKEQPQFLLSTAVIVVELLKLTFAIIYIQICENPSRSKSPNDEEQSSKEPSTPGSIVRHNALVSVYKFIQDDWANTMLLAVPAAAYSLQMSMEYVAFANIDASTFSVLVQGKMLTTAFFFWVVLKKKLVKRQIMSLVILTMGVMLCSIKSKVEDSSKTESGKMIVGVMATLGIAVSSGFASVYTEKVIKSTRKNQAPKSLAHMQAQLATVSLVILGLYTLIKDSSVILEKGFFYKFNIGAFCSCLNSAVGGLIVAGVLKHANSVLKGYATASSVVLTGILSNILFGTSLSMLYGIGMVNVVCAVLLYNGAGLEDYIC